MTLEQFILENELSFDNTRICRKKINIKTPIKRCFFLFVKVLKENVKKDLTIIFHLVYN